MIRLIRVLLKFQAAAKTIYLSNEEVEEGELITN